MARHAQGAGPPEGRRPRATVFRAPTLEHVNDRGLELLLTPAGWDFLNSLPPYDEDGALALSTALRREGMDPDLVAAGLTQSRLRARASEKFGEFAANMLFTADGLEQATRLEVAALHARRYAQAGLTRVADLGCGIGGDALALAALGLSVLAVEQDAHTAQIATVNLRPFPEAQVLHADAMTLNLQDHDVHGVFMDPARRTRRGTRVFDPASYSPDLDAVLALREMLPLGVKVGPGIPYPALPSETHAQWVSVDGAVVEAGLWFGPLRETSGRSALLLERGDDGRRITHELTWQGDADAPAPAAPTAPLASFLYEPARAVIRSGLVARLAHDLDAAVVDEGIAYLTTDTRSDTPFATGYRVLDAFDFGVKRLRGYLRTRGVGRLTIKKRGTAVTPEQLRPQLHLAGDAEATIVLTRVAGKQTVIVVDPL